ncbi:MAG TPA: SIR2 family protein, partial [Longimicrobium sp.]|nr:SIR2 family protein [Longimicrobium sp.]
MESRTFAELVDYLKRRRTLGYRPPVLLVGAGASFEAGIGTMRQLFEFTGVSDFDEFVAYIRGRSADERYIHLSGFLQTQAPAQVTPGYRALAALLAENYFDLVLSTNFDPLLEDALANARMWRKDYILLVNGIVRPERLDVILREPSPRVKIIKVHGDLFHRYMAWTPDEMAAFIKDIRPRLNKALAGRDIIIVGYSMSDEPVRELVTKAGGRDSTLWYLHFAEVPAPLRTNPRVRGVVDPVCRFEHLFPALATALDVPVATGRRQMRGEPEWALAAMVETGADEDQEPDRWWRDFERSSGAPLAPAAKPSSRPRGAAKERTLDDLMASVVGLAPAGASPAPAVCTGFVLADPHVIVSEDFDGQRFPHGRAVVVTGDGRRLETVVLGRDTSHTMGPVCLRVPDELRAPGLHLNAARPQLGLGVRVAVAAGARVGVSSGSIGGLDLQLNIMPVGMVSDLASIDTVVAPGSSGAPVVDAHTLAVRGYIVA